MKKPDITTGEWRLGIKPGPYIYGDNGTQVASCDMATNFAVENIANSKAIAALPKLLEALEDFNTWLICPDTSKETLEIMSAKARTALLAAGYTE